MDGAKGCPENPPQEPATPHGGSALNAHPTSQQPHTRNISTSWGPRVVERHVTCVRGAAPHHTSLESTIGGTRVVLRHVTCVRGAAPHQLDQCQSGCWRPWCRRGTSHV
eukprot:352019-Chlamydomonas_euryale.AAC.2